MNAYMDAILPENRNQPNPLGLVTILGSVAANFGLDLFGLDFDFGMLFGDLLQMSIKDLKLTVLEEQGDYVLIQAEGGMRYPVLLFEAPFCDQHDVRKVDGKWYVDVFAPEREARLETLLALRQQDLADMALTAPATTGNLETDLLLTLQQFGKGMEIALDLCVPTPSTQ